MRAVRAAAILLCAALGVAALPVNALDTAGTRIGQTDTAPRATHSTNSTQVAQRQRDLFEARVWGISPEEVQRARLLMQGPRGAFSVSNISPVEVLGIHARTPAEKRKYAELFARLMVEDSERVLAFQREYDAAVKRLYPDLKVVDFRGQRVPAALFGAQ